MKRWYLLLDDEDHNMLVFDTENEMLDNCAALGWVWSVGSAKHLELTNH